MTPQTFWHVAMCALSCVAIAVVPWALYRLWSADPEEDDDE